MSMMVIVMVTMAKKYWDLLDSLGRLGWQWYHTVNDDCDHDHDECSHEDYEYHDDNDDQKGSVGTWQALGDRCDNPSCSPPLGLPGGNTNVESTIFQHCSSKLNHTSRSIIRVQDLVNHIVSFQAFSRSLGLWCLLFVVFTGQHIFGQITVGWIDANISLV